MFDRLLNAHPKRSVKNCDTEKNKTAKHCWQNDNIFNWDEKKVMDDFKQVNSCKNQTNHIFLEESSHIKKKFPTCYMQYGFLIYVSPYLLIYLTPVHWLKLYSLISLISWITQLFLTHVPKFCYIISVLSSAILFLSWTTVTYSINLCDIIIYLHLWWEKYLSQRNLINHIYPLRDKLVILWTLNRKTKIYLIFSLSLSAFPSAIIPVRFWETWFLSSLPTNTFTISSPRSYSTNFDMHVTWVFGMLWSS